MATTADYVGKNCPYCGAIDSIETDEARGEAACTACATVIAMGLEESVATRWEKDVTFADADREDWRDAENSGSGSSGRATAKNAGLTREEAAAAAAGLLRRPTQSTDSFDAAKYEKTKLHPRQSRALEALFRLSRRHDEDILLDAMALAKRFVGHRRERSVRVEHQTEVAAACLMLAAERHGQPIPLGEVRVLDPSLKDVESRRREVIEETNLRDEVGKLDKKMVPNLIHYYLQLLQLPLVRYEQPCLALFKAIRNCEATNDAGAAELALLVEAEKVVMAVLLARTAPQLRWGNKPTAAPDPAAEPPAATLYSSFASSAHLQPQRVQKIMRVAEKVLPRLAAEFHRLIVLPEFATATVRKMGAAVALQPLPSASATGPTRGMNATAHEADGTASSAMAGAKRPRSRSTSPPAPPSTTP
ncbi:hypothetical protein ABB37_08767 [Leptomonas pyrrhocoris]|uniref:TFIIB-type domain-containing protein n=1 Tax=Leptomonas pyrrhocoris TaxID=157538 RepID=A0A0M9FSL0_LEPPY|nr:hypothetical protein ABB37_08767 [Leptomonas pyrrhocoris]KPA75089.1 hypothetical protein ABB37_08767 [Leptomonas pyrrhocoris]|eukprot:XP_015653528.1 hypothetical protein ABB37_08767 [Leptomonas pyrrhocoris]